MATTLNLTLTQGDDKVLKLPILDDELGAIDLTNATDIKVVLSVNNLVVKKYELGSLETGAIGLAQVDAAQTNAIQVLVRREHSRDFPLGLLKAEVAVNLPDAVLGNKATSYSFVIGSVLKGATKDESLVD